MPGPLREARFVSRLNRFAALVTCEGKQTLAHVPNSGRLRELLDPDNPVLLAPPRLSAHRKTEYDLALVDAGGVLVSIDARLPPKLLAESLERGALPEFSGYATISSEVTLGESRIDLALSGEGRTCYLEAKSVTLVERGVALFPDAPTVRGRKHLETLTQAVRQGYRGTVAFVIQRSDAHELVPNEAADPQFCRALQSAAERGVEVYAYRCGVTREEIEIVDAVPVRLK